MIKTPTRTLSIILLSIFFVIVYKYIYDEKVDLNGDNAAYYILGTSIASGQGYRNISEIDKPIHGHFPPGYPIIIAGIFQIFPNTITTVKVANGIFLLIAVILFFHVAFELTQDFLISISSSLLIMVNASLLKFSTIMMSEMVYLMLSLVCVLLLTKLDFSKPFYRNKNFIALIIVSAFAFHVRSIGLSIIASFCLYFLLTIRWKYLFAFLSGFILLSVPWKYYLYKNNRSNNSYLTSLFSKNPYRIEEGSIDLSDWSQRVLDNIQRYLTHEIPYGVISFGTPEYKNEASLSQWVLGFLIVSFLAYGLIQSKKFRLFFACYFVCTFGILLNWPSLWTGTRFLFQLIPFILLFALVGFYHSISYIMKTIHYKKVLQYGSILVLVTGIGKVSMQQVKELHNVSKKGIYPVNFSEYFQIAAWCNQNLDSDQVIAVRKPNLFYLYSGRFVSGYLRTLNKEELITKLKDDKVTYVILDQLGYSSTLRNLYPAIKKYPYKFKQILKTQSNTYLFQFRPNLGYTGSFDDQDQRSGFGRFVFEDGSVYEGEWKNGVRNGSGKHFLQNGHTIIGNWVDDKPSGKAQIFDATNNWIKNEYF